MELIKLSEAYTLTDVKDNWTTNGQVTVEISGAINISFSTTAHDNAAVDYVGNVTYNIPASNEENINSSCSYGKEYVTSFRDYSEVLIKSILDLINLNNA